MALEIQRLNFDPVTGDNPSEAFLKLDNNMGEIADAVGDLGNSTASIGTRLANAETVISELGNASTKNVGTVAGTVAAGDDGRFASNAQAASSAQATANAAMPKSGGSFTGPVKFPSTASSLIMDGPNRVIGDATGNIAPLRINSTLESGATNAAAAAFLCLYRIGFQGAYFGLSGTGKLAWGGWSQGEVEYAIYHAGDNLIPSADNVRTLGSSSQRFTQLYAVAGTINTSDRNFKTDIVDTTLGLDFVMSLRPVSYKLKEAVKVSEHVQTGTTTHLEAERDEAGNPVLDESGDPVFVEVSTPVIEEVLTPKAGVRDHQGLISQEVADALASAGVDPATCGIWTRADPANPGSPEGLRYEELIAPLIKAVQELAHRVAVLENGGPS